MEIKINTENINCFLHYGWLPRTDKPAPFPQDWIPFESSHEIPSFIEAGNIFREAVNNSIQNYDEVIIPLSGGLDSRAILAATSELGKDITAVTVGSPGTYDFEIGKYVAGKAGVKHEAINFNEIKFSTSELVATARETGDWTNIIEVYGNLLINKRYRTLPVLSGFLGDFLAGSYSHKNTSNWEDAKISFYNDNNNSWNSLTNSEFNPMKSLPVSKPPVTVLSNYEQLVLQVRHTCSLRPTVFSQKFNYVLPFNNEAWVRYILSIPREYRYEQKFYIEMLIKNWPQLFSLPAKNFRGAAPASSKVVKKVFAMRNRVQNKLSRSFPSVSDFFFGIEPNTNYTDFHKQIVINENLRSIIRENLADLESRNMVTWLPLKMINRKYFSEKVDLSYREGMMLLILANLEINLKSSSF